MLRHHLVCGVNDRALQKHLLAQPDLTYQKAVELVLSAETIEQSMRELVTKPESGPSRRQPPQEVHKTSGAPPELGTPPRLLPLWSQRARV